MKKLHNQRPAWLDNAHKVLDAEVAAAYGWDDYSPEMADEEILGRLLALDLERAGGEVTPNERGPRLRAPPVVSDEDGAQGGEPGGLHPGDGAEAIGARTAAQW